MNLDLFQYKNKYAFLRKAPKMTQYLPSDEK